MQTKIGAVIGTYLIFVALVVWFGNPLGLYTNVTADFLEDVHPFLWGMWTMLAGVMLVIPGPLYRKARVLVAAVCTMSYVGVNIWPAFTEGPTDSVGMIPVLGWLAFTTMLVLDKDNPIFSKELEEFSDYAPRKRDQ